jgi:PAS domain S-box-containing protein
MTFHQHDIPLVALSAIVAILGAYTTLDLFRRVRVNAGWVRVQWLVATSVTMGLSIWTMHFVAMLALQPGMPVLYDVETIVASLAIAIAVSAVAFVAAARPRRRPLGILAGGLFTGLAICAMHYTAMAAMRLHAQIDYEVKFVALSVLLAAGASTVAFLLALQDWRRGRYLLASSVLGIAIVSMHYAAMAGVRFLPLVGEPIPLTGIGSRSLAFSVTLTTFLILLLGLTAAWFDRRFGASEARFLSLGINMRGIVFCCADPGHERATARLYGLDAARITGVADAAGRLDMACWRHAIHPEDLATYEAAERRLIERHEPFTLDYRIVRPATGEVRWVQETAWAARDPAGGRVSFDSCMIDRTERKCFEAALRESEESNRRLVEAAPVAILTYADWRCTYANPRAVRLLGGRSADDLLGRHILDLVEGEAFETMRRDLAAGPRGPGDAPTWELTCTRSDGTRFPAEAAAVTILHRKQPAVQLVLVDLTERKQAEAAQALLIDELNHRVKNILATIDAMIGFTAAGAGSPEELGAALAGRIAAMSRTHDLLTSGRWAGVGLRDIVLRELQPYAVADRVAVTGEQLQLTPKAGLSLSLVLHELMTNALKYGALSVAEGRIEIAWSVERHRLRLVWQESGGPAVAAPARRGFGTTLIERAAVRDLGGKASLLFAAPGLRCELECPLARIAGKGVSAARADDGEEGAPLDAGAALAGSRVLVAEDETLLTMVIESALSEAGAELIGPAGTLAEAVSLARAEPLDAAVLDVNLDGEAVFPVADLLRERGVPFVFATGYAADMAIPARHRDIPRLPKPYRGDRLRQVLAQAMKRRGRAGPARRLPGLTGRSRPP